MRTTASSKSSKIYDKVRQKWVEATPEELIRQQLIDQMLGELGYPLSFLSIESELAQLPHLKLVPRDEVPNRRADIIAFQKTGVELLPLLMVECKAVPLTPKFAQQVVGYNEVVQAPFVALANQTQVLTGYFDHEAGHYEFKEGLPSYASLLKSIER